MVDIMALFIQIFHDCSSNDFFFKLSNYLSAQMFDGEVFLEYCESTENNLCHLLKAQNNNTVNTDDEPKS